MQPLIPSTDPVAYQWAPIVGADGMSLKNSHFFHHVGGDYLFASDMLRGGTIVLRWNGARWEFYRRCFEGWTMMWNPCPVLIDGQVWVYVCDTAGGSPWYEHMRIYRHTVGLESGVVGPLIRVEVCEDQNGMIDPCLIHMLGRWHLFYARLWDPLTGKWWDPGYSVSDSPFGPFTGKNHLGVTDHPGYLGIDEAFKVVVSGDRKLLCTGSYGDSGTRGDAFIGEVKMTSGYLWAEQLHHIQSIESDLCTALDLSAWPRVFGTLRRPGETDLRSGFYIAEMV